MELLMPEMIDTANLVEVQKAMGKDLRVAAKRLKGKPAWFAVAEEFLLSDKKKVTLFVTVKTEAEAKAWHLKLKGLKPKALAMGTCTVDTKDGLSVQVGIEKVIGDRKAVLRGARLAFKLDRTAKFSDPKVEAPKQNEAPGGKAPAADAKVGGQAAKTAAAALSSVGLSSETAARALGVSADEVNAVLSQNADRLKAAVDRELAKIRQGAAQ